MVNGKLLCSVMYVPYQCTNLNRQKLILPIEAFRKLYSEQLQYLQYI